MLANSTIVTVAGNGSGVYWGDGGPATLARWVLTLPAFDASKNTHVCPCVALYCSLNGPTALLSDDAGGFYVTDTGVSTARHYIHLIE